MVWFGLCGLVLFGLVVVANAMADAAAMSAQQAATSFCFTVLSGVYSLFVLVASEGREWLHLLIAC